MAKIVDISTEVIEVPLRHAFVTSKDSLARMVSRPVVITIRLDDGTEAVGEAVPVEYVTGETVETVVEAVEDAAPRLKGLNVGCLSPILRTLEDALPFAHTARAGIEIAVYNAFAAESGVSLWTLFGGAVNSVETDVTLSISADCLDRAIQAANEGFRKFKMKVGGADRRADFERIAQVHRAVPDSSIRLDANQGFDADDALRFIDRVVEAGVNLELVEQPVPDDDLPALDTVAAKSPVPIIADECIQTAASAIEVLTETRVHGVNVKLMKSGISGALDIIAIARAANRKLMIGCMLETRRGISASVALACGTGAFDYLDLDSHLLLAEPEGSAGFSSQGPCLSLMP